MLHAAVTPHPEHDVRQPYLQRDLSICTVAGSHALSDILGSIVVSSQT